jgi:hypothetical protein
MSKDLPFREFDKNEAYWSYMSGVIRNKTFNKIFEMESDSENFYLLSINNDVHSNITVNPYFAQVSLFRVN